MGTFGPRNHLNIFFPQLWSHERGGRTNSHQLTEEERALWYEHGMRPAVLNLFSQTVAAEWAVTLEAEKLRAQRSNGPPAWSSKQIPREAVGALAGAIRAALTGDTTISSGDRDWARDFFILHTVRGTKHSSPHHVDPESATLYLQQYLMDSALPPQSVGVVGEWFIDVGIQISSDDGGCLQWMTDTHNEVIQQALRISRETAVRISEPGFSKYQRDLSSHLTAVSGFRVSPGANAEGIFEAKYLQAYTTDKAVVYNIEGNRHAKFVGMKEAMGTEHPVPSINNIFTLYHGARTTSSSSARLEVRVPYVHADQVLLEFDVDALREFLCSFTMEDWW